MVATALPIPAVVHHWQPHAVSSFLEEFSCAIKSSHASGTRLAVFFIDIGAHAAESSAETLLTSFTSCLGSNSIAVQFDGARIVAYTADISSVEDVVRIAKRMEDAIALNKSHRLNAGARSTVPRIGATIFPDDGVEPGELLEQAYSAMLDVRKGGALAHKVFDFAAMRAAQESERLAATIIDAIDAGEIQVYYQPKIDLVTGAPVGVEALVRWSRGAGDIIEPVNFLQQIHSPVCLLALDSYILERAVMQSVAWRRQGIRLGVSVNASPKLFNQREYTQRIIDLLDSLPEFDPSTLTVEVLETLDLDNVALASELFTLLRSRGIKIYLDDFGTGRSSAAYLKMFSFDGIKIDRSFVRDLPNGPNSVKDLAIIEAALLVARAFNVSVIVEGIEQHATALEMIRLGIRTAQGYLFAKPMPADALAKWFETNSHSLNGLPHLDYSL